MNYCNRVTLLATIIMILYRAEENNSSANSSVLSSTPVDNKLIIAGLSPLNQCVTLM